MIIINFQITNPNSNFFKMGLVRNGKFTKNKSWELQFMRTPDLVMFTFEVTRHSDHAGVDIEIGLATFNLGLRIHDNRHWDDKTKQWEEC